MNIDLNSLPNEILRNIFTCLSNKNQLNLRLVNHKFNAFLLVYFLKLDIEGASYQKYLDRIKQAKKDLRNKRIIRAAVIVTSPLTMPLLATIGIVNGIVVITLALPTAGYCAPCRNENENCNNCSLFIEGNHHTPRQSSCLCFPFDVMSGLVDIMKNKW